MKVWNKKRIQACIKKGGRIVRTNKGMVCKVVISKRGKGLMKGQKLKNRRKV